MVCHIFRGAATAGSNTLKNVQTVNHKRSAVGYKAMPEVAHSSEPAELVIPRLAKYADSHTATRLFRTLVGTKPAVVYPKARISTATHTAVFAVQAAGDGGNGIPRLRVLELASLDNHVAYVPADPASFVLTVKGNVYKPEVVAGDFAHDVEHVIAAAKARLRPYFTVDDRTGTKAGRIARRSRNRPGK
jgi:hypothetical protein